MSERERGKVMVDPWGTNTHTCNAEYVAPTLVIPWDPLSFIYLTE